MGDPPEPLDHGRGRGAGSGAEDLIRARAIHLATYQRILRAAVDALADERAQTGGGEAAGRAVLRLVPGGRDSPTATADTPAQARQDRPN
jgi:hypothetical protein